MSAAWEKVLARALRAEDPVGVLRAACDDPALPPATRRAFTRAIADGHGLRMAALLVAKLRFERIVRGSGELAEWFERDAQQFTEAFRSYHAAMPLDAVFPAAEARAFAAFCARRTIALDTAYNRGRPSCGPRGAR